MNAQAGPSRPLPSRSIDLSSIPLDRSRITNSISSSSIAPSLSTHRSSTQSTVDWGGLHTPRSERLSLCISECSITEEDVVVIGPGKDRADRSIDSVILEDAQLGGLWLDLVSCLGFMLKTAWLIRSRIRLQNLVILFSMLPNSPPGPHHSPNHDHSTSQHDRSQHRSMSLQNNDRIRYPSQLQPVSTNHYHCSFHLQYIQIKRCRLLPCFFISTSHLPLYLMTHL